jgi:hypothetical protein
MLKVGRARARSMVRIPKNLSLDKRTHAIASEMDDFSGWVRARLLAWNEDGHGPFVRHLQEVSTRKLVAILLERIAPYGVPIEGDENLTAELRAWMGGAE